MSTLQRLKYEIKFNNLNYFPVIKFLRAFFSYRKLGQIPDFEYHLGVLSIRWSIDFHSNFLKE